MAFYYQLYTSPLLFLPFFQETNSSLTVLEHLCKSADNIEFDALLKFSTNL